MKKFKNLVLKFLILIFFNKFIIKLNFFIKNIILKLNFFIIYLFVIF